MISRLLLLSLLGVWFSNVIAQECKTYKQKDRVLSVDVSPDGKYIACCVQNKNGIFRLLDFTTGKLVKTFVYHNGYISRICYSHDGQYIAAASRNGSIQIWDVKSGKIVKSLIGHTGFVSSVCFSPDDKYLLSSCQDLTTKLWEISTGKIIRSIDVKCQHNSIAGFSPDGKNVVISAIYEKKDNPGIIILNLDSGKSRSIKLNFTNVTTACFSPDGEYIVCNDFYNYYCYLINVKKSELIRTFKGHENWVYDFKFSPNMKYLFSCSHDADIKIWDIETGELKYTFTGHFQPIISIAFSNDYKYLVSGSIDKKVKVWKIPEVFNMIN
jgi:WD40 repeat protein